MEEVTFGLAFIAGLLSFVSPCVLPLVPAYVGYMGGRMTHTVAVTGKSKTSTVSLATRLSTLTHGLAFVLGFTFVFVSLGIATTVFISALGGAATLVTDVLARVGGVIIIIFGLHFMGALRWFFQQIKARPQWLNTATSLLIAALLSVFIVWGFITPVLVLPVLVGLLLALFLGGAFTQPQAYWLNLIDSIEAALYADTRRDIDPNKASSLSGSFLMGMVFSAGWTPCIGPIYGGILNMALQGGSVVAAGSLLATYSLGLGIPFLLTALMLDGAQSFFRRVQKHMHKIEVASGILLLIIGTAVATGSLQNLSQQLSAEQADFSIRVEECGTDFFRGELDFADLNPCINGELHLVSLGQRAEVVFTDEMTEQVYQFSLDASTPITVELSRMAEVPDALRITLRDESGAELATSGDLQPIDDAENEYIALMPQMLDAGTYEVLVTATVTERTRFRVKVAEAENIELGDSDTTADDDANSATTDLFEAASGQNIGLEEGMIAPDFTVTALSGEEIQLSQLRGQIVLINFWGTWCGPCIREMPELQESYEQFNEQGFTVVGLAVRDTREDVLQFREDFELTFPLALDDDSIITNLYNITNQPSTFIIDEQGEIVFRWFGPVVQSQIEEVVQEELAN